MTGAFLAGYSGNRSGNQGSDQGVASEGCLLYTSGEQADTGAPAKGRTGISDGAAHRCSGKAAGKKGRPGPDGTENR